MNTTKLTLKLFLVISLFCTTVFAGDMGSGGFADDGDMGSGGKACTENCLIEDQPEENPFVKFVRQYLISIFG